MRLGDFGDAADVKLWGTLELVAAGNGKLPVQITLTEVKKIVLDNTGLTKIFYLAKNGQIKTAGEEWRRGRADEQLVAEAEGQGEVLAILRIWQGR